MKRQTFTTRHYIDGSYKDIKVQGYPLGKFWFTYCSSNKQWHIVLRVAGGSVGGSFDTLAEARTAFGAVTLLGGDQHSDVKHTLKLMHEKAQEWTFACCAYVSVHQFVYMCRNEKALNYVRKHKYISSDVCGLKY